MGSRSCQKSGSERHRASGCCKGPASLQPLPRTVTVKASERPEDRLKFALGQIHRLPVSSPCAGAGGVGFVRWGSYRKRCRSGPVPVSVPASHSCPDLVRLGSCLGPSSVASASSILSRLMGASALPPHLIRPVSCPRLDMFCAVGVPFWSIIIITTI